MARRYLLEVPTQRRSHGMSGLDVRSLVTAVWVRGYGRDAAEGELQAVLDALTDTASPR